MTSPLFRSAGDYAANRPEDYDRDFGCPWEGDSDDRPVDEPYSPDELDDSIGGW